MSESKTRRSGWVSLFSGQFSLIFLGRVQNQQKNAKLDTGRMHTLKEARKLKHLSNLEKDNYIVEKSASSSSSSSEGKDQ
jgi:hypothetical protein